MDRDAVIARYRHLQDILKRHNSAVIPFVSRQGFLDMARRLGMLQGSSTIVADSADELTLVYDLAIHSPRPGRSRPIDRYRKAARPTAGSDDALVLDAMAAARFTLWRIERRHEVAGLVVLDIMRERELWLMDLGLEASGEVGMALAGHLIAPGPFSMTTGMMVPLDPDVIEDAFDSLPPARHGPAEAMAADPLFATHICRAALAFGNMEHVTFV
ncbi:MAG: hypothetical protein ACREEE_00150 [Dongiaceae bacterium]